MRHIDASAVLDLWEHYPFAQFPAVWDWIDSEFSSTALAIADVALDEVGHKEPDCRAHLQACGVTGLSISNSEVAEAVAVKFALGIINDEYGGGVDENDIFIIATAKCAGVDLVTNEKLQLNLPNNPKNYKIPAVCALPSVNVHTLRLIEYIRQSGRVFK